MSTDIKEKTKSLLKELAGKEIEGKTLEELQQWIKEIVSAVNTEIEIFSVLPKDSICTADFKTNRLRVFYEKVSDTQFKIVKAGVG